MTIFLIQSVNFPSIINKCSTSLRKTTVILTVWLLVCCIGPFEIFAVCFFSGPECILKCCSMFSIFVCIRVFLIILLRILFGYFLPPSSPFQFMDDLHVSKKNARLSFFTFFRKILIGYHYCRTVVIPEYESWAHSTRFPTGEGARPRARIASVSQSPQEAL